MTWTTAWWTSTGWVVAVCVPAIAVAIWRRRFATHRAPRRLTTWFDYASLAVPFLLPVFGAVHSGDISVPRKLFEHLVGLDIGDALTLIVKNWSWKLFVTTAVLEVIPVTVLWPIASGWGSFPFIERRLRRAWRAAGLPSLSVAVVRADESVHTFAFGVADRKTGRAAAPETLYAIGSITKVFTTTLLAILRDRGAVQLDDPVAKFLPPDTKLPTDPCGAPAITLRHLATHSSGLPRLPVNLVPKGKDPYGGYTVEQLYAGLGACRLDSPIGSRESYSNLGVGLLGHALERAAGRPYEELLREFIFEPLAMTETSITLTSDRRAKRAVGYEEADPQSEATEWDLGCLTPAGGIVSSAVDLTKFLLLQLRAGRPDVKTVAAGTLHELHTPQRLHADWQGAVGLGWQVRRDAELGDVVWHNGGLDGFASFMAFAPGRRVGVVVLTNCGRSVDELGAWLLEVVADAESAEAASGPAPPRELDPHVLAVGQSLVPCFVAEPPDQLADHFHTTFLASIPLDQIKPAFHDIHAAFGTCQGVEAEPSDNPRRGTLKFKFAGNKSCRCDIEIDGSVPPRIVYMLWSRWDYIKALMHEPK